MSEIAERLNVSSAFVYARLADGSLKHYRLGKAGIRVSEEQLQEYLRGREHGGHPVSTPEPIQTRPGRLRNLSLE